MKQFLILLFCMAVTFQAFAQQDITVNVKDAPLSEILESISEQSSYRFIYKDDFVVSKGNVTVSVTGNIQNVLDRISRQCTFSYEISDNSLVVISAKAEQPQKADDITVSGRVYDQSGEPVAGCMVLIQGTSEGTMTDEDGCYSLDNVQQNTTLTFSFIGMKETAVAINGRSTLNVRLESATESLDEIVVIGYGVAKRSDLTGSVASVRPASLEQDVVYSVEQSLKGRAAGVRVMTNSSSPGSRIEINIRGGNSMIASNAPLYVVDGFPLTGGMDFLNPADIESLDILKDASATAIYGSRGANGVILITTKQGAGDGKKSLSISSLVGVSVAANRYEMLDAREYATVANEWLKNDGKRPFFDMDFVQPGGTDWQDLIFRNSIVQDHTVSFSGSGAKTRFMISGNWYSQDGIVKGTAVSKGSVRANLNSEFKDWLSMSFNVSLSRRQKDVQNVDNGVLGNNVFSGAMASPPTLSPYNSDGLINQVHAYYSFTSPDITNPLLFLENKNTTERNSVLGNFSLDFRISPWLTFKTMAGLEYETYLNEQYTPIVYKNDFGTAAEESYTRNSFLNENTLTFNKTFGLDHNITAVAGFTCQSNMSRSHTISVSKFISNITENYDFGSAENVNPPSSSYNDWRLASFLGRINYSYANRYLFTVSFRADGSSRFGKNNKWGYFPSGAFAWKISEEKFMKRQNVISSMKLRASYGLTGNTAVSPYQTLDRLSSVRFIFGEHLDEIGYAPTAIANEDLRWETTAQFDIGLDFGILNDRVTFVFDYYRKHTTDLLASSPVPWSTGYRTIMKNIGEIQNNGVEFSISADAIKTRNVKWNLAANISHNENKVLKLDKGSDINGGSALFASTNIAREGEPLGAFYGYLEDGLDIQGFIRYKDVNEDGVLNSADRVILGSPYPDFIYGLSSDLILWDFTLSMLFEGSLGNSLFWETAGSHLNSFQKGTNQFKDLYGNYWTEENPDRHAKYPKISKDTDFNSSDRFVKDASYFRLKNLTLTYTLPVERYGLGWLAGAQIYVACSNVFTITKYPGLDPDVNTRGSDSNNISTRLMVGVDASAYPLARTFTAGIRLKF